MLTIGKTGGESKARWAQLSYYTQQVVRGAEDYYAGKGEAPAVRVLLPAERTVEDVKATKASAMTPRTTDATMTPISTGSMGQRYSAEGATSRRFERNPTRLAASMPRPSSINTIPP